MDDFDIVELGIDAAQHAFATGRLTSEALTQRFLDRIDTYNPHYNRDHLPQSNCARRCVRHRPPASGRRGAWAR